MTTFAADAARPVGRPRSVRASESIVAATLQLLAEDSSIEALSIEAIAARAGVGKATIYRRWPNKEALVIDAIATLKGPVPRLAGRSVRDDLLTLLRGIGRSHDAPEGRVVLAVMPEIRRNPDLSARYTEMIDSRREVFREVLRRGIDTGEVRPDADVELAMAILTSSMISITGICMYPRVSQTRLAERLVDTVLAGIGPPEPR